MEVKPTSSSFRQYMSFWGGQTFSLLGIMYLFSGLRKLDFKVIKDTTPTSELNTPTIIE